MNITQVPPDLVDTEFGNPNNQGSIYLTIFRNNSVSPPIVKRSINELIVTNDVISFKFFS